MLQLKNFPFGIGGVCDVTVTLICKSKAIKAAVLLTDPAHNTGTSVTNGIEEIASAIYRRYLRDIMLPSEVYFETLDQYGERCTVGWGWGEPYMEILYRSPEWFHLKSSRFAELLALEEE